MMRPASALVPAGLAVPLGAGKADHRDDELARLEARRGPRLGHLADRLVAEDEVVAARRGLAELEVADLAVGPADARLQDAELDVVGRRELRLGMVDDADLALRRKDAEGLHAAREDITDGAESRA